jgi:hypothetical protein
VVSACRTGSAEGDVRIWNRTLGVGWSQVLNSVGVHRYASVVEVGPGCSDKMAHALAALGFRGRLVLVDPTPAVRRWTSLRYRLLLPDADIVVDPFALSSATTQWGAVDAIVSNHVLDDMLFRLAVPASVSAASFQRMRPGRPCAPQFVDAWHRLRTNATLLERLVAETADEFARYAEAVGPQLVIVNHYPSWTHGRHGLSSIHEHGLRVLHRLEDRLGASGFRRRAAAVPFEPRDASWLIVSRPHS